MTENAELKLITVLTKTENVVNSVDSSSNNLSNRLELNESLALAKITKADSPFFPAVVREDEPVQEQGSAGMIAECGRATWRHRDDQGC